MIATSKDKVGLGIYSVPEAAYYARLRTQTMRRWLFGNSQGDPVLDPEFGVSEENQDVSFLDFVQSLAIRSITTSPKSSRIPIQKIRQAVEDAKAMYGIQYPLAMRHKVYQLGNDLVIKTRENEIVGVSGTHRGNKVITEIAEIYMRKIEFGDDGLVNRYKIWGHGDDQIVMDPKIRFGEPVFLKYGIPAETLFQAVNSEGNVLNASECHEVPQSAIFTAIDFFDHLEPRSAA